MHKITLLFLLIYIYSCDNRPNYKGIINQAEILTETQLDSAYLLLSSISIDDITNKKNKAKFALVYSDILNKKYSYIKNDSLIIHAVNYYSENGNNIEKAKSFYLLGCVYWYANNIDYAVKNLTQAATYEHNNNKLKANIYNAIGYLYMQQKSYDKAINYWRKSVEQYKKCDSKTYIMNTLSNIGAMYFMSDRYNEALFLFQQSNDKAIELNDTVFILSTRRAISAVNQKKKVDVNIIKNYLLDGYKKYNKGNIIEDDYGVLSNLYLDINNIDSARYYLNSWVEYYETASLPEQKISNKISPLTTISILNAFKEIETKAHNYKKALEYDSKADVISDSIHLADKNKTIQGLEEMYNNKLYKESLKKSEYERSLILNIFIVSLISIIFIVLLLFYKYRLKMLKKGYELDQQHEILKSLSNAKYDLQLRYDAILIENKNENSNQTSLSSLKIILGKISDLIEKTPRYEKDSKKFVELFLNIMNSSDSSQSTTLLYEIVNKQYNGILDYLKDRYKLSQYELELCSMICMGFSNSSIRILLNHTSTSTIYNYRSKLKAKLGLPIDENNIETFFNSVKNELSK